MNDDRQTGDIEDAEDERFFTAIKRGRAIQLSDIDVSIKHSEEDNYPFVHMRIPLGYAERFLRYLVRPLTIRKRDQEITQYIVSEMHRAGVKWKQG